MLIAIHAFAARLKAAGPDAVGFLYYSGHGIASAGENYLIRTDVALDGVAQRIGALGFHSSRKPADQNCIVMVKCSHSRSNVCQGIPFGL